ncbi:MAG: hypothetical protein LBR80_01740 [Deltaproteobacteria bacterium]|jgi:hypothetical protein|nr:hypothetical protein [Deltaproteobacteria bacterium]
MHINPEFPPKYGYNIEYGDWDEVDMLESLTEDARRILKAGDWTDGQIDQAFCLLFREAHGWALQAKGRWKERDAWECMESAACNTARDIQRRFQRIGDTVIDNGRD